ncbi:MAG: hypothetical protein IT337_15375 [Thermomicrobiales bacterium]|nr:hypothetical protein [Thermomicrobiales bacterium]
MANASQTTGVSDLEYDIVMTLGNLLQGEEALQKYAKDADKVGNAQIAGIFHSIIDNHRKSAKALRDALKQEMSQR